MKRLHYIQSGLALAWLAALAGCQMLGSIPYSPFPEREGTTYLSEGETYDTPAMRTAAMREFAARSTGIDTPEQRELTDQLARQMQIEPDPLVRAAVARAIGAFRTPLAKEVLEAGLSDSEAGVRMACCRALGERGEPGAVAALARSLREDKSMDVRLAAAEALGQIPAPESLSALVVALDDRDPAMQYVGVQSMKALTGKDYGGDVAAWRELAGGGSPPLPPPPTIAERLRGWSPF